MILFGCSASVLAQDKPPAAPIAERTAAETSQIDVIVEDAVAAKFHVPDSLTLRVRILQLTPFKPTQIQYKYGGWGAPGERVYGYFWKPKAEPKPASSGKGIDDLLDTPKKKAAAPPPPIDGLQDGKSVDPRFRNRVEKPPMFELGEWSDEIPLKQFVPGGADKPRFLQVFGGDQGELGEGRHGRGGREFLGAARGLRMEFEFFYEGKSIKRFTTEAPDGPIASIVIPFQELIGDVKPTDALFLDKLTPLVTYVERRADWAARQPWAVGPKPERIAMVTNLGGYGPTSRLGVRHAEPAIVEQEARILRAMGINGFQDGPSLLVDEAMRNEGTGAQLGRGYTAAAHGYPVPVSNGSTPTPHAGCPFGPDVEAAKQQAAAAAVKTMQAFRGIFLLQGTTVDEIGVVVDGAPEGKAHLTVCPHCRRGFHAYLESMGLTPADFGDRDWSTIAPVAVWGRKGDDRPWMNDQRQAMLAYWTLRFNNYSSARLFGDLRKASREENAKKRAALAAGDTASDVARQPWHYPGAMRGNSFLMGGHSLDFFDFYRTADNAFIYETSNRDARVWSWDSYLCDVGRVVTAQPDMGQELFGVYVKPHRGAGMQRGLSAVSRGARYINWYTYGPSYAKGDDWGSKDEMLATVGRTNRLIAGAEEVLYEGQWTHAPRIAVVKPGASEIWMQLSGGAPMWSAAWENAKWIYTALAHAHLPVDPIDQVMIRDGDLSRYDVIYVNGPALERAAAKKLVQWVENGGTLVTMGFGLSRDEYCRPLEFMQPVLGLKDRTEPEMWQATKTYGATALQHYDDKSRLGPAPAQPTARVSGSGIFEGGFDLTIGREVLHPENDADVVARYGDGGAAAVRHAHGRGEAYVLGFFAGLEYVVPLLNDRFLMQRDFDDTRRRFATAPALQRTKPVVDLGMPTIEGILIRQPKTGRQVVTLMNWTYGVTAVRKIKSENGEREQPKITHIPAENVRVSVRGAGAVAKVRSLSLEQDFPVQPDADGDGFSFTLPHLAEGDILLLNPK
ncbi:MAG: hypothetical protein K8U03_26320 [Planctomycetia bacterium]|nr:hypothetical protein [Planctomycetia bacterium]